MKSILHRAALLCLMLLTTALLIGCGKAQTPKTVLWVVTEKSAWDGMNSQADQLAKIFEAKHPGFSVKLDILPQNEVDREMYLKQIRTEIMGGRGPDVFLLPTKTALSRPIEKKVRDVYETEQVLAREWEPLFFDVERVMQNGLFADVSDFYEADESLGKEDLNTAIMDAGTYRGGRYLLPLRYDFPVLYVNVSLLNQLGFQLEDVDGNILELLDLAIESGKPELTAGAEPFLMRLGRGLSLLSQPTDGETETVLLTKTEIVSLFDRIQNLEELVGEQYEHRRILNYVNIFDPYDPIEESMYSERGEAYNRIIGWRYQVMFPDALPLHVGTLPEAIWIRPFAQTDKREYAMLPLRGTGDTLNAYVTYYGAVGGGCEHPKEAYEFLRLFLLEDAQFEQDRPFKTEWYLYGKPYHPYLLEDGWPVRINGSAQAVWKEVRDYVTLWTSFYTSMTAVASWPGKYSGSGVYRMQFSDRDLPLLEAEFDHIYFGNVLEQDFAQMVRSLNDQRTGEPNDVDIDAMAEAFIEKLRWQVLEG